MLARPRRLYVSAGQALWRGREYISTEKHVYRSNTLSGVLSTNLSLLFMNKIKNFGKILGKPQQSYPNNFHSIIEGEILSEELSMLYSYARVSTRDQNVDR